MHVVNSKKYMEVVYLLIGSLNLYNLLILLKKKKVVCDISNHIIRIFWSHSNIVTRNQLKYPNTYKH